MVPSNYQPTTQMHIWDANHLEKHHSRDSLRKGDFSALHYPCKLMGSLAYKYLNILPFLQRWGNSEMKTNKLEEGRIKRNNSNKQVTNTFDKGCVIHYFSSTAVCWATCLQALSVRCQHFSHPAQSPAWKENSSWRTFHKRQERMEELLPNCRKHKVQLKQII